MMPLNDCIGIVVGCPVVCVVWIVVWILYEYPDEYTAVCGKSARGREERGHSDSDVADVARHANSLV